MTAPEFFHAIRPDITVYGVLLTLAVVFFAIGKHFWRYENELRKDYLERLKDLLSNFRRSNVEPLLQERFVRAREDAYDLSIKGLLNDLYPVGRTETGQPRKELVDEKSLKELISTTALEARLSALKTSDTAVERFLSTASGDQLFDNLDRQYERKGDLTFQYHRACQACYQVAYSFFSLALIVLLGLIKILYPWPDIVFYVWILLAIEVFCVGIWCLIKLELHRSKLLRRWEGLQLYARSE
jgi:hypothetical protein